MTFYYNNPTHYSVHVPTSVSGNDLKMDVYNRSIHKFNETIYVNLFV